MTTTRRPPPWRDVRYLTWAFQLAVIGVVVAFVLWIRNNLDERGFDLDYSYLDNPARFPITGNPGFRDTQPVSDALREGLLNTARLVVAGVVLATILGTVIGIARLSENFLLRTAAQWYVEVIRNVPLIGILIIAYSGIALNFLPNPRVSFDWSPVMVANTRGVSLAWFEASNVRFALLIALVVLAMVLTFMVFTRLSARSGTPHPAVLYAIVAGAIVLVLGWIVFRLGVTTPKLDGLRTNGGIVMTLPFFAALTALVLYTSSHIAEIVRGSIQAVAKGQGEAANALALSGTQRLRFVVLPQAMRIALPPIGNQYLNLAKNSSLAAVVTFPELTKVTQLGIAASTMPAVASLIMLLGIYMCISLILSALVNAMNRRLALVER